MGQKIISGLLIMILAGGCVSVGDTERYRERHRFESQEIAEVVVEMQEGLVQVVGSMEQELIIDTNLIDPNTSIISKIDKQLVVSVSNSAPEDEIMLMLPAELGLQVRTFGADVKLDRVQSQIEVRTYSGDIEVTAFSGQALLWAGRGNIEVREGTGALVLIGEYGVLSADRFVGQVSMSTIMGTLRYLGVEAASNPVQLETDHGPVEVGLPESANYHVQVRTTSGYVTCIGNGMTLTVNGCEGIIGDGREEFKVRTVSGRVDLRVISNMPEN
jgi:DUF4097 and DUF4098 domain-containing protein YvlB